MFFGYCQRHGTSQRRALFDQVAGRQFTITGLNRPQSVQNMKSMPVPSRCTAFMHKSLISALCFPPRNGVNCTLAIDCNANEVYSVFGRHGNRPQRGMAGFFVNCVAFA